MIDLTFQKTLHNLTHNIHFSYARYGDGEWNAILGKVDDKGNPKENCDNHKYFPDMGKRLKRIIDNKPKYYIGLQSLAKKQNAGKIEYERLVKKNQWCGTEIFTKASIKGRLHLFFDALKGKNIIFVGNKYTHDNLSQITSTLISVPETNCWNRYDKILSFLKDNIKYHKPGSGLIILYCASMMTNVLIGDIHTAYGDTITQLDMGSVFDPYIGRNTRSYHKTINIQ